MHRLDRDLPRPSPVADQRCRVPEPLRDPVVVQHSAAAQRRFALEVGYQGSQGHKLQRYRIWNQPVSRTGPNDARTVEQRRPWPAYGNFQMVDPSANSNYNALSAKL